MKKSLWIFKVFKIYFLPLVFKFQMYFLVLHRRRIKTEEKANVVAAVWGGEEFIQFLAALAVV